jgi:hypothetical protein
MLQGSPPAGAGLRPGRAAPPDQRAADRTRRRTGTEGDEIIRGVPVRFVRATALATGLLTLTTLGAWAVLGTPGIGDPAGDDLSGVQLYVTGTATNTLAPGVSVPITIFYRNADPRPVRASKGISIMVDFSVDAGWPATCSGSQFTVSPIGAVTLAPTKDPAPLPVHTGGVLSWTTAPPDQKGCLAALAALGGVPLILSLPQ